MLSIASSPSDAHGHPCASLNSIPGVIGCNRSAAASPAARTPRVARHPGRVPVDSGARRPDPRGADPSGRHAHPRHPRDHGGHAASIPIHENDDGAFRSPLDDFKRAVRKAGLAHKVRYLSHGEAFEPRFAPEVGRVASRSGSRSGLMDLIRGLLSDWTQLQ
jgi:hypothetical protein